MRHASFTGSPLAVCVTAMLCVAVLAGGVHAAPNPIPAGSKLVYNFNVLGYPAGQTYNGNCGNGHRIFVNREASKAQVLVTNGSDWTVLDCNATSDHQASLQTSQVGLYDIYMRILGKPGGHLGHRQVHVADLAPEHGRHLRGDLGVRERLRAGEQVVLGLAYRAGQ